jgi:hypothetical protein
MKVSLQSNHPVSLLAVSKVVVDFMRSVGKGTLVEEPPQIFSWLTVHDSSTSYHGRHYHRNQALIGVLYLDVNSRSVCPDASVPHFLTIALLCSFSDVIMAC